MYGSGLRLTELLGLRVKDVDLDRRQCTRATVLRLAGTLPEQKHRLKIATSPRKNLDGTLTEHEANMKRC
jgi:site-specific recombinase XerC